MQLRVMYLTDLSCGIG